MTVLFGHPAGNPNSHHAALAHFEASRLEAFCAPWLPSRATLAVLRAMPGLGPLAQRLARRRFSPLDGAMTIQGRAGEMRRLLLRALGGDSERLSYQANDWLMRTMARHCRRASVTGVHAYEDCSLWQFAEAKRLGKACIYDMPIGYYDAWARVDTELRRRFEAWLPPGSAASRPHVRPEQKRREMALADVVLVPSTFTERTIREFHPTRECVWAPYGVDADFWTPAPSRRLVAPLRFIAAGQLSLRKGVPLLLDAWTSAHVPDAELELVGQWQLAESKRCALPAGVTHVPPCSALALRERFRAADVFVFPSFFEGFGLALLEAMACGLPAISTEATAAPDLLDAQSGRLVPTGNLDALVEVLRWFGEYRSRVPEMGVAARTTAERHTWGAYRRAVSEAVAPFI